MPPKISFSPFRFFSDQILNSELDFIVAIGGTAQENSVDVTDSIGLQGFEHTLTSVFFDSTSLLNPFAVTLSQAPPAKDDYRPLVTEVMLSSFLRTAESGTIAKCVASCPVKDKVGLVSTETVGIPRLKIARAEVADYLLQEVDSIPKKVTIHVGASSGKLVPVIVSKLSYKSKVEISIYSDPDVKVWYLQASASEAAQAWTVFDSTSQTLRSMAVSITRAFV